MSAAHPTLSLPLLNVSQYASLFEILPYISQQYIKCATSLASAFDADLVHAVGSFLAEEAKVKSSVILLAPTCNIQRSPLAGRAFESFSEDSHLSGESKFSFYQI